LADVLKLLLQAQKPIDGKTNEALIRFLAALLDVLRSSLRINRGLNFSMSE